MKQISMVVVPGPKPGIALLVHFYILLQNFICKFGCISSPTVKESTVLKSPANNSTIMLFYEVISTAPLVGLFLSHGVLTPSYSSG